MSGPVTSSISEGFPQMPPFSFSGVYVFGDSLVDAGNALKAAEFLDRIPFASLPERAPTAARGYFQGRFTDGYNFADLISNKLVHNVTTSTFPYGFELPLLGVPVPFAERPRGNNLNFAYGGAQARQGSEYVPDLDAQLDAYKKYSTADPNALYIVTVGGNDVREMVPRTGNILGEEVAARRLSAIAADIATEINGLYASGARHILVSGAPDISLMPIYNGSNAEAARRDAARRYSVRLEELVTIELASFKLPVDARLYQFSLLDLSDRVITAPSAYALTNLHEARTIVQQGNLEAVGRGFLFFDDVHPSAQANALIAAEMIEALELPSFQSDWNSIDHETYSQADVGGISRGTIETVSAIDQFTIALRAGGIYSVNVVALSSGAGSLADPILRVTSPYQVVEDDDSGIGLDARVEIVAAKSGSYTVEVAAVGVATGSYELRVGFEGVVAPVGTIATGTSNELLLGSSGRDLFLFDTAGGVTMGRDVIRAFGQGDRIVTTAPIYDANGDGRVRLSSSDWLSFEQDPQLGELKIFNESGRTVSNIFLVDTQETAAGSYYIYAAAGDMTGSFDLYS